MAHSQETVKVQAGPFRAAMRNIGRCGIITPETILQAGLRGEDYEGPTRIFFGDQTAPESMRRFAELSNAGIAVEVEVSGYFKWAKNGQGDIYLDDRALFVEEITVLS